METNKIIRRLELVRNAYEVNLYGQLPKSEIDANMEAQNLAIQAVKLLEKIEQELQGNCSACKYIEKLPNEQPCKDCSCEIPNIGRWEFRWPLGKDTTT